MLCRPMQEVSVECPQAQLQVPPDHRSCCQSCGQTFSPDDLVVFCPGCDDVVYCSLECGERDRPRHESECPTVALNGFKDKLEGLITCKQDRSSSDSDGAPRKAVPTV